MLLFVVCSQAVASPLQLEPVWTVDTGPLVNGSLSMGPQGLAVRRTTGDWVGLAADGQVVGADLRRLGWWDQVGDAGTVVFGQTSLALVDGGRARIVDSTGERTLDGLAAVVFVADGGLVGERPGTGLIGIDAAGDTRWEVAGAGTPELYDDRVARRGAQRIEVFEGSTGRLVDVVLDGGAGVGAFAPFAGCTVVVPSRTGHPTRCWRDQTVVWEAALQGLAGDVRPVVGDLDGDGRNEVVVVAPQGTAFVLDPEGRVVARGDVGVVHGSPVVSAGQLVVAHAAGVGAFRLGAPTGPSEASPPAVFDTVAPRADVDVCFRELNRSACVGVGEASTDERGTAGALALACTLGEAAGCRMLADRPALAQHVDDSFWETGCRLGDEEVCVGWFARVEPDRRAAVAAFACSQGVQRGCSLVVPPPVPPLLRDVAGTVFRGEVPLAGAVVRAPDATAVVDKRGRFALRTTADQLSVEHPALRGPMVSAVKPRVEIVLEPGRWVTGRVVGDDPPAFLDLVGCRTGRVAVQADGTFIVRDLPADAACTLVNGSWSGTLSASETTVLVERIVPDVPAMRVLAPDGSALANAELSFGRTGADGLLVAVGDEPPCADGAVAYEGYLAVCQLFRWPVKVVSEGPVLLTGGRSVVADAGWVELEPGEWTAMALDGEVERQVTFTVKEVTAVALPRAGTPAPVVTVLTPDGWPAAGVEVAYAAGSRITGADGTAALLGLTATDATLAVDGVVVGRPRDGRLVRAPLAPSPIRWEQRPLGLVALEVDQTRVDVFPGDVLREACGADVHDLSVQELHSFARSGCPATVWRAGEVHAVTLP